MISREWIWLTSTERCVQYILYQIIGTFLLDPRGLVNTLRLSPC